MAQYLPSSSRMANHPDIEFLFELGSLRNTQRSWRQFFGVDCANDLEHSMRVAFIALLLARRRGEGDEGLILTMALLHDLAESRTGDMNFLHKRYVKTDEHAAISDTFAGTSLADLLDVVDQYKQRTSIEAKLVKDADILDVDVELRELEERGSGIPAKWRDDRRKIRESELFTDEAKTLGAMIVEADPSTWPWRKV